MPVSFLSLCSTSIQMFFVQRMGRYSDADPSLKAQLFIFPFVFLQLTGPVFSLVLAILYLREYVFILCFLIGLLNWIQIYYTTGHWTKCQSEYVTKDQLKRARRKVTFIAAFTSWISTSSVGLYDKTFRSFFLLFNSSLSIACHLISTTIAWGLANAETGLSIEQYPLTQCLTVANMANHNFNTSEIIDLPFIFSTLRVVKQCKNVVDCEKFIRICEVNEYPADTMNTYIVTIAFALLFLSFLASFCLQILGNYKNLHGWSKKLLCSHPVIHYTLIHDWIRESKFEQIESVIAHLDSQVINTCDPVLRESSLHILVKKEDTPESRKLLKVLVEQGGNIHLHDSGFNTPFKFMNEFQKASLPKCNKEPEEHESLLNKGLRKKNKFQTFLLMLCGGRLDSLNRKRKEFDSFGAWLDELCQIQSERSNFFLGWIFCLSWINFKDVGSNFLHLASIHGFPNLIRFIIDKKIHPVESRDAFDNVAIGYAAFSSHPECLRLLLENTKMIDLKSGALESTAVHAAAKTCAKECLEILIEFKAQVNLVDKNGNTPLHLIAIRPGTDTTKAEECCEVFLNAGADFHVKNNDGKTPLETNCHLVSLRGKKPELFEENISDHQNGS